MSAVKHYRHGWILISDAEKITMPNRLDPGSPKIQALKEHIARHGVLKPIQIEESSNGSEPFVSDGHHRLLAAKLAGLTKVPTITYDGTLEGRKAARRAMMDLANTDLAITPGSRVGDASSLAKPGYSGPRRLTNYERMIAHALIRKGKSKSTAIAMAKAATKRMAAGIGPSGRGHVRPQVQAGAIASVGESLALRARNHARSSSHANDPSGDLDLAFRYRHGWIPLDGTGHNYSIESSTSSHVVSFKGHPIGGATYSAQRNKWLTRSGGEFDTASQAIAAVVGHHVKLDAKARKVKRVREHGLGGLVGMMIDTRGGGLTASQWSAEQLDVLDFAVAEARRRDLDLTAAKVHHWRHGWIALDDFARNIAKARKEAGLGKGSTMPGKARVARQELAKRYLSRHTTEAGFKEVTAAGDRSKAPDANLAELTQTAQVHASKILDRITNSESKITSDFTGSVRSHGGSFDGLQDSPGHELDFRFKTVGSLTRKIRDKSVTRHKTQEQYAADISDALRYTAVFDHKTMVKDTLAMKKDLEAKSYKFTSIENTFVRGQAYSGVNMNLVTPDGTAFEVQVHTPESIRAKHIIYKDYEIYRSKVAGVHKSDRIAAYNRMVAVNRQLIRPYDWQRLGTLKLQPDMELHRESLIRAAERQLYERGIYKSRTARQRLPAV